MSTRSDDGVVAVDGARFARARRPLGQLARITGRATGGRARAARPHAPDDAPLEAPPLRARHLPGAVAALVGGIVLVAVACLVVGPTLLRLAGVAGLVAIGAGVVLHRRILDRAALDPLVLLACGVAVLAVTQGGLTANKGVTWESAAVLLAYPLLARSLGRMFSVRMPGRESDLFVQAGLGALAAGVALTLATSPAYHHQTLLPILVAALDAGLLTMTARLVMFPGERVLTYRLLALALAYLFAAHLAFVVTLVRGPGHSVLIVHGLGALAFVLFGLAALHPSVKELDDPIDGDPPTFSAGHLLLVIGASLAGPAAIGVRVVRHEPVSRTTAAGGALVALMLAAYTASLIHDRAATEHRVQHDELTGLPNRSLLVDRISRALAHARRTGSPVAVLFIDLDRFKWVNDTFGHGAGDALLKMVAARLTAALRDEDTVARLGGDEFAVLLPHVSGPDGVVTVAEKVRDLFRDPVEIGAQRFPATASIGVAISPYDGDDPEALLASADTAMYRAKEAGRNTFEIYSSELSGRAQERLAIEGALLGAIERGELVLHYQPVFDVATAMVVGAEALVRWEHPEQGLILPAGFIPIAEQSDLVVTLGTTVLAAACRQIAAWTSTGFPPISVSVNVSARQLRHGIADLVAANLRTTGIEPSRLVLELTETAAVDDVDRIAATLAEVQSMGVRWAIDDFGTGYCSMTYLSRLPVDSLKIDKSFVQSATPADESIVSAIIAMAHGLGLTVVAEGVETTEQLRSLSVRGCDRVQGFLVARQLPAKQFEAFVRRQYAQAEVSVR